MVGDTASPRPGPTSPATAGTHSDDDRPVPAARAIGLPPAVRRAGEREVLYSVGDLHDELDRFERELRAARLRENSIDTYVGRSRVFLKWLNGDYRPHGPRS